MSCRGADPPIVVLAWGNPLCGDDAVGWHIAERLERRYRRCEVGIIASHQLTPELAEPLSRCQQVIFIDASCSDPPGIISQQDVELAPAGDFMAHHVTPGSLLQCAQALYGHCPRGVLLTIGAMHFDLCRPLSPPVRAAIPKSLRQCRELIESFQSTQTDRRVMTAGDVHPHAGEPR